MLLRAVAPGARLEPYGEALIRVLGRSSYFPYAGVPDLTLGLSYRGAGVYISASRAGRQPATAYNANDGRLAQGESASLTRKRSEVQIL